MSVQEWSYTPLPNYSTNSASLDQRIGYLEDTGRSRRRIIQPIGCCLSPLTCSVALFGAVICGMVFGCSGGCCGSPDWGCSQITKMFSCCDLPPQHKCGLFFLVCVPCTPCANENEEYLLPPEREEMNDIKGKRENIISLEIIEKITNLNIIQIIFEYAKTPPKPVIIQTTERPFIGPGWSR